MPRFLIKTPDSTRNIVGEYMTINAERGYGWSENPWVWVISFERCEKLEAADV